MKRLYLLCAMAVIASFAPRPAAAGVPPPSPLAVLKAKYARPNAIPFPAANPYSDAKEQLGRTLFFDPRLSEPATTSCATCHNPGLGWKDGLPRGVGHDAKTLPRATPTILDLAWADLLMWDGRKDGLEDQASGPITGPTEMSMSMPELVTRLSAVPGYQRLFAAAYKTPVVSADRIVGAIATFERTVVSNRAPFDRWIAGEEAAIPENAKHGFVVFNGSGHCAACHSGWRFTDDGFHDIGLASPDIGRGGEVPDVPVLQHAFKTPTLRNIDRRAPYMHDGSVPTLAEVIRHYDTGFLDRPSLSPEMRRLNLSEQDRGDLVAFLHTLTSQDDPISVPVLPTIEER